MADSTSPRLASDSASERTLAERLERGDVVYFPVSPFSLPQGADLEFLLEQRLGGRAHKNISYDPRTARAGGFWQTSPTQAERLRRLLADFSHAATEWVAAAFPLYAQHWQLDRVSYRPEEEATRRLRLTARNDLLHVDAFPSRPTNGWRILRVFVNVNPSEPRVWVTSDPFAKLLARYGERVRLPAFAGTGWMKKLGEGMLGVFQPKLRQRSEYDSFMLRLHNFMKRDQDFQDHCPKHFWHFQPGSAWMAITDTASHAVLRGRYALEHSYFLSPESLALPEESPAALLEKACHRPVLNRAA